MRDRVEVTHTDFTEDYLQGLSYPLGRLLPFRVLEASVNSGTGLNREVWMEDSPQVSQGVIPTFKHFETIDQAETQEMNDMVSVNACHLD
jgi:hypothetical protein